VLRTSSWLAPSLFTNRPCDLPVEKTRDASNRCLPPKRTACTRTSCVPGSARSFRCVDPPRSLGLRAGMDRGSGRFTASEDRFGRSSSSPNLALVASRPSERSVGVFFPRCERSIEPLTALSRFPFNLRLTRLRGCCDVAVRPPFGRFRTGRRMRRPPRPPSTPTRENRRLVMIRDAFHR